MVNYTWTKLKLLILSNAWKITQTIAKAYHTIYSFPKWQQPEPWYHYSYIKSPTRKITSCVPFNLVKAKLAPLWLLKLVYLMVVSIWSQKNRWWACGRVFIAGCLFSYKYQKFFAQTSQPLQILLGAYYKYSNYRQGESRSGDLIRDF